MKKFSSNFKLSIDIVLFILILIQSFKKGGFYTSDSYFFMTSTFIIAIVYLIYFAGIYIYERCKDKEYKIKINKLDICVGTLAIAYSLAIIFGKAVNLIDAQFEFFRYITVFLIYLFVRNSEYKKIYSVLLVTLGVTQALIGIDGLANRVLNPILNVINSGYLNKDFTRLSGTIQYANTTAIIIAIAAMFSLNYLKNYLNTNKKKLVNILFVIFTILNIALFLTVSRMVILIYTIYLIYYLITNKKTNKLILTTICSIFISILATSNISALINIDSNKIYVVFASYAILSSIVINYIYKYTFKDLKVFKSIKEIKYKKIIVGTLILVIIGYIFIGLNTYSPLEISNNKITNTVSRQVYGVIPNQTNTLSIDLISNSSNYSIVLYTENNEYIQKEIKRFDNVLGKIEFEFIPDNNVKRLNIVFKTEDGNVLINELKLNNIVKPLEYKFLPSDIIFRTVDFANGSSSTSDRIEYVKDGMKIFFQSPIVGLGGEAFKYSYKSVQTVKYNSTEVHSSIIQVAIESGILGFLSLTGIFVLVLVNKNKEIKYIFIVFLIHSFVDLNFSYLISLIILAVLAGIINEKKSNM